MERVDIIALVVGGIAALLRAVKKRLNWKMILLSGIMGAFIGFGMIGILTIFLEGVSTALIVFVSFAGGWLANEITDILEEALKDGYDLAKAYAKNKTFRKK